MSAATPVGQTRQMLSGPTMGTRWSAIYYGDKKQSEAIATELQNVVDRVDEQMSPWKPTSVISVFNATDPGTWIDLPEESLEVIEAGLELTLATEGAFDPFVGELVDLWGFGPRGADPELTGIARIEGAWTTTERRIEFDRAGKRIRRHSPVGLDLCGIAKGYGVDRLSAVLSARGFKDHLVCIDGEVRASGTPETGAGWTIALEQPDPGLRAMAGRLCVSDLAVATSGSYRHQRTVGGRQVSHTMDPFLGRPADNGLVSVTVLADTCLQADALATALMVMGRKRGMAFCAAHGVWARFAEQTSDGIDWFSSDPAHSDLLNLEAAPAHTGTDMPAYR